MKNPIRKRIVRQIFASPGKYLPLGLAMVFIVVFASSFFTSQDSVKRLYYAQLRDGRVEDGEFTTAYPLSDTLTGKLEKQDVEICEKFSRELSNGPGKTLRAFENRKQINIQQILSGRLAQNSDEVALSANYARVNQIAVNDCIELSGKKMKVVGLVSLPDYSSLLQKREDLVMNSGHFGICLLDEQGFEAFSNLPISYTYAYHHKEVLGEREGREKLKQLIKLINQENMTIDGVIQQDNHCITYLMDDMEGDVPTMTTSMVILFVALAFISAVQMQSLIERESPVIGTLLASGYKKKELLKMYMTIPIYLSLAAGIVGNIIAYSYAYKKYVDLYYQNFDLPDFKAYISLRSFLITCIIPLLIYLVVNYLVLSRSLRFSPLDFLRGNLRKERKKSKLHLGTFKFLTKYRIRVLLDNKLNLVALLFGIFMANIILVFGLAVRPVFHQYAQNMKDTMKYNYTYLVKTEEPGLEADKATILQLELVDQEDKKIQIYGVDPGSKYWLKDLKNLQADDIVVSEGFLQRFSYQIGDRIRVRDPYNSQERSLRIKDVEMGNNLFQLFSKREYVNQIIDKEPDYLNAYLSGQRLEISQDNIITVIDKNNMTQFMEHFLEGFGFVFDMLFYIGIGFSLIVTALVTNLIIDKSKTNLGYLKIFGFRDREIASIYIQAVFLLILVFQFLIIPGLDRLMQWLMYVSMTKFDAYIIADIPFTIYLQAVGCSLLVFLVTQVFEGIKLARLDKVKALKIING